MKVGDFLYAVTDMVTILELKVEEIVERGQVKLIKTSIAGNSPEQTKYHHEEYFQKLYCGKDWKPTSSMVFLNKDDAKSKLTEILEEEIIIKRSQLENLELKLSEIKGS